MMEIPPQSQEEAPVLTGLTTAKSPSPTSVAPANQLDKTTQEMLAGQVAAAKVAGVPQPAHPGVALATQMARADFVRDHLKQPAHMTAAQREQERLQRVEKEKREFYNRLIAKRRQLEDDANRGVRTQPLATQMKARTDMEMAAGAKALERHEENIRVQRQIMAEHPVAQRGNRAAPSSVPVFRPADYVPDLKKNQGANLGARDLSA